MTTGFQMPFIMPHLMPQFLFILGSSPALPPSSSQRLPPYGWDTWLVPFSLSLRLLTSQPRWYWPATIPVTGPRSSPIGRED
ncbi:unnamed protein product [Arctogadus glacialis]